jgi:hypothetical protein
LLSFGAESFALQLAIKNVKIKVHRNTVLLVVSYGCENWSLTLREKRRLRVFENLDLRNEITEEGRTN